jgi:hypothetical protein
MWPWVRNKKRKLKSYVVAWRWGLKDEDCMFTVRHFTITNGRRKLAEKYYYEDDAYLDDIDPDLRELRDAEIREEEEKWQKVLSSRKDHLNPEKFKFGNRFDWMQVDADIHYRIHDIFLWRRFWLYCYRATHPKFRHFVYVQLKKVQYKRIDNYRKGRITKKELDDFTKQYEHFKASERKMQETIDRLQKREDNWQEDLKVIRAEAKKLRQEMREWRIDEENRDGRYMTWPQFLWLVAGWPKQIWLVVKSPPKLWNFIKNFPRMIWSFITYLIDCWLGRNGRGQRQGLIVKGILEEQAKQEAKKQARKRAEEEARKRAEEEAKKQAEEKAKGEEGKEEKKG